MNPISIVDAYTLLLSFFVLVSFKLISEYLDQILPQKEMKEVFSVRLHTENLYFCLRQKLNKI